MNWTGPQNEAITYKKNKNVLVSAAAGSGKTAVLVERVIQKILDEKNPVSVDEILVLTFTEAAAKEMKTKIESAIEKKLKEFPDNKHLRNQSIRIASADISTIHAFAKKTIENNIHLTDIPVGFSIISETENKFLKDEILDKCLERFYERFDSLPSFADLTLGHGGIKNDSALRDIILRVESFSQSLAQPKAWLNNAVNSYKDVVKQNSIADTVWEKEYQDCIKSHIEQILCYYNEITEIINQNFADDDKITLFYQNEKEMFLRLYDSIANRDLDKFFELKSSLAFGRRPTVRGADDYTKCILDQIANLRDTAKKEYTKPKLINYNDIHELSESIIKLYPRIKTLKNIILMMSRSHSKYKLLNSYLDFNDLEHHLIALIMNSDGTPTKFCEKLGQKYKEILVDEYQDTNNIQDTLFRLLSGDRNNIFMVGDIKQSIYKFRNASPKLFLEKYKTYSTDDENDGHLIKLSNNFRSRSTVVDSVNYVFKKIMHESTAELEYTEDEFLYQSIPYPNSDNEEIYSTEMLMTKVLTKNTASGNRFKAADNKRELEGHTIANRVIDLIYNDNIQVKDDNTGELRPAEFGDIVVLTRNWSAAREFSKVFYEYGIPVSGEFGDAFLESIEVATVISFLQIIDNPLQDIPLLTILRSPMFGFSAEELTKIKSETRYGRFFLAVKNSAKSGDPKSIDFLNCLNDLRTKSKYMGVDELIYVISNDLHYSSIVGAMRGGKIKQANLKILFDHATNFERTSLKGLFNFVGYLEKANESGVELGKSKANSGTQNAVTFTSIHKSKGLEYPIVFVANTASERPHNDALVCSEELGIGIDYVDTKKRIKYSSLSKSLITFKNNKDDLAEEMRLLYVAMTRAKEKLIISCTDEGTSKDWLKPFFDKTGNIIDSCITKTEKFRDWLVFSFLGHKNASQLRDMMNTDLSELKLDDIDQCKHFKFECFDYYDSETDSYNTDNLQNRKNNNLEISEAQIQTEEISQDTNNEPTLTKSDIENVLGYKYPNEVLTKIPLKLSVSEIKRSFNIDTTEKESEYIPKPSTIADRSFHRPKTGTSAEIGTITHYIIQHTNPELTETKEQLNEQIMKMIANNVISESQAKSVDVLAIFDFYQTDIGKRVVNAYKDKNLYREFKFLIPIDASEIYTHLYNTKFGDEKITVQGIADCFFFEDDGIILVDYKTDNCLEEQAEKQAKLYTLQLEYYAKGLEMIFNKKVKEKIVYFTKPHTAIKI